MPADGVERGQVLSSPRKWGSSLLIGTQLKVWVPAFAGMTVVGVAAYFPVPAGGAIQSFPRGEWVFDQEGVMGLRLVGYSAMSVGSEKLSNNAVLFRPADRNVLSVVVCGFVAHVRRCNSGACEQ
jgi:hypothetical protein